MTAISAEVVRPAEMDAATESAWATLQASRPAFRSPYYSLEFLRIVAAERDDLRLGILYRGGEISGFLPFHLRPGGRGAPLAGPISDYQGILGAAPAGADATAVLRACGLTCYDFDHALAATPLFRDNAFRESASPLIDLGAGFAAWRDDRRKAGSALKTVERKLRKMERELGPVRFEPDDRSDAAWETLMGWKRAALAEIGVRFALDLPWAGAVARRIRAADTPGFAGRLSTLYAGDRLVAAHFGMRSGTAWHWWFPGYDAEMSAYTPGLALLLRCAEQAAAEGLVELDLGRGAERYKREFANGARALCEGSLERAARPLGVARLARKALHRGAERLLPVQAVEFQRRAFNRMLRAGHL
ncbi:GNAT family N-acetyltransferase [Psychromarinibacter sp. C21-152]|uniref:GNAT family N-acetyltransferase n=1 Tax=Psychromarinibacter sediminicola TaxID=3033385 RepID=A0AAE3NU47_9RHOB|nr:GNAT family N-acetyltransferase [Psychromarinibacter sediminicola]MDF0602097.1 GNAT family N-acetyltransferase [Psychromarinibacter sediminicola]